MCWSVMTRVNLGNPLVSNLPARGTVYDLAEDHVDDNFFLWVLNLVCFYL